MKRRPFKEVCNQIEEQILSGRSSVKVPTDDLESKNEFGMTVRKWIDLNYPQVMIVNS